MVIKAHLQWPKRAGFGNSLQPNEAATEWQKRGRGVAGWGDMQNGQRQAIKSMPKLIYLRELHKIDKLQMHLELTGREEVERGKKRG